VLKPYKMSISSVKYLITKPPTINKTSMVWNLSFVKDKSK